ncbi:formate dehydrogenase accessory sulfurtransferase FdhD [Flavobacterium nitratireducens]|uniref:formate dehydrogenase accessory sulfurtransferase FdhD n=1 Tax=Flavobacterium nitratireducens TaxID=992289 RepID=UPI002414E4D9|nr:formate dehydrogenase accessory sulfurtransferase FdhD [Flavobacterium nitratireducens]
MEIQDLETISITNKMVQKVFGSEITVLEDILSIEEPLEIRLKYIQDNEVYNQTISVTMRTPGNDVELALGFLFTEGIISSYEAIQEVNHLEKNCALQKKNSIQVVLNDGFTPHLLQSDRNFYTTSSCGVCGKSSIESIKTVSPFKSSNKPKFDISASVLYQLPQKLRAAQSDFANTGGIHASGLFSKEGELLLLQEDVGRHNALDKLIGQAFAKGLLPLHQHILLLSGRISFELVQKAAMAGISIVVAIGAPSSLAVELAQEFGMTLIGFLNENRFNIYHSATTITLLTEKEQTLIPN